MRFSFQFISVAAAIDWLKAIDRHLMRAGSRNRYFYKNGGDTFIIPSVSCYLFIVGVRFI